MHTIKLWMLNVRMGEAVVIAVRLRIVMIFILLSLAASALPVPSRAQTNCPSINEIIQLAPEITRQPSSGRQMFYQHQVEVSYQPGQQVMLSSHPAVEGDLSTDDLGVVHISPSGREWRHDFRNPARTQIVPTSAQDITALFTPGVNRVELQIMDLLGPEYSSRPYYLIIVDPCERFTSTATPTPTPTATAVPPTETFTPTGTATDTPTPNATETGTPIPTATATFSPTPSPLPTATKTVGAMPTNPTPPTQPVTPTSAPLAPTPEANQGCCDSLLSWLLRWWSPSFAIGFGIGFIAVMGLLWHLLSHPRLPGALEIINLDEGTIWTVNLDQYGSVVTVGPQGQIPLDDEELPEIAGSIYTQHRDGSVRVFWQHQAQDDDAAAVTAEELTHNSVIQLGRYRLTYQNFGNIQDDDESWEGGIWHEI